MGRIGVRARWCPLAFVPGEYASRGRGHLSWMNGWQSVTHPLVTFGFRHRRVCQAWPRPFNNQLGLRQARDLEWVESLIFDIYGAAVPFMGCARLLMGGGNFNVNWVLFNYLDVCWQQVLTYILLEK